MRRPRTPGLAAVALAIGALAGVATLGGCHEAPPPQPVAIAPIAPAVPRSDAAVPIDAAELDAAIADPTKCDNDDGCTLVVECCPSTTCGFAPVAGTLLDAERMRMRCSVMSCAAPKSQRHCKAELDRTKLRAVCRDHVCVRVAI